MAYAELVRTMKTLPQEKQAEVIDFVGFLAARYKTASQPSKVEPKQDFEQVLSAARGSWPKMTREEIDDEVSAMRNEWERDAWKMGR